jgi:dienelactone hydrolase
MDRALVTYEADGLTFHILLYHAPTDAPQPGILVFPHAFGLDGHATSRAERLSALGYAVLACDLHGGGRHCDSLDDAIAMIGPLRASPDRIRTRASAALDALLAQPGVDARRIAAIGYCFGGTVALELARSARDIAGTVGFIADSPQVRPRMRAISQARYWSALAPTIPPSTRPNGQLSRPRCGQATWTGR